MEKELSEMTLGELWMLFPIELRAPDPHWAVWYAQERQRLSALLPGGVHIHHIGSTAIGTIWAKPIVDLLVEADEASFSAAERAILDGGYLCMHTEPGRRDFNKGYTKDGFAEKVFHLHLRVPGDCDELYFRDYMIAHPDAARQYEAMKLSIWKQYEHNRDGYTEAKGPFISEWTALAKHEYAGRYNTGA